MPTFLENENIQHVAAKLKHFIKMTQNPDIIFNTFGEDPLNFWIYLLSPNGIVDKKIGAMFAMEQYGNRVKLAVNYPPGIADAIQPILQEIARHWPETASYLGIATSIPVEQKAKGLGGRKPNPLYDQFFDLINKGISKESAARILELGNYYDPETRDRIDHAIARRKKTK